MSLVIAGLGTAVPETTLTQDEARGLARVLCCRTSEQMTWLPLMYTQTGIETRQLTLPRRLVDDVLEGTSYSESIYLPTGEPDDAGPTTGQRMAVYAKQAFPLAVQASARAMEDAAVSASSVTHLVTVSCTGFIAPGVDASLIRELGLSAAVARTHIGFMGCHAALNGLRVASAFTSSDPSAVVLLCAVELCSLHYHYGWDPQRMVANAIFGDGAAALVGKATGDGWRLQSSGSFMLPDSAEAMGWTIGDHGFEMMLSKKVPSLIARNVGPWMRTWLDRHGLSIADIGSWAIHPGGPKILEAVEEGLNLPREATTDARAIFAAHGNMSSPTVLFIVDRLRRRQAPLPCVAVGFGPGLAIEAALFV